jgi:hypothetical protein
VSGKIGEHMRDVSEVQTAASESVARQLDAARPPPLAAFAPPPLRVEGAQEALLALASALGSPAFVSGVEAAESASLGAALAEGAKERRR